MSFEDRVKEEVLLFWHAVLSSRLRCSRAIFEKAQICLGRTAVARREICGSAKRGANVIADSKKAKNSLCVW